jgi:hypothetical protein
LRDSGGEIVWSANDRKQVLVPTGRASLASDSLSILELDDGTLRSVATVTVPTSVIDERNLLSVRHHTGREILAGVRFNR